MISANTDIGTSRSSNEDGVLINVIDTVHGRMVLAVLCDGMGGLSCGDVASTFMIRAFENWSQEELPDLCRVTLTDSVVRTSWERLIETCSREIQMYGNRNNMRLGTTIVAILITQVRYYVMNVGDSRAYELTEDGIRQLTEDQTVVNNQVRMGILSREEAQRDPNRHVLSQCVGASKEVYPEMFFGVARKDAVYLLCSDGFYNQMLPCEIQESLRPSELCNDYIMTQRSLELIEQDKRRGEHDNITVALVRTY